MTTSHYQNIARQYIEAQMTPRPALGTYIHIHRGALWIALIRDGTAGLTIRIGKPTSKPYTERNQGKNGLPIQWRYYLGEHLAIRRR
jgi:hypothetical protein